MKTYKLLTSALVLLSSQLHAAGEISSSLRTIRHIFALESSKKISGQVELVKQLSGENPISCKNFRMRIAEADIKQNESDLLLKYYHENTPSLDQLRYVLDQKKSYLGFYDYHSLIRLRLKWPIDENDFASFSRSIKTLQSNSLNIFSNLEDLTTEKVNQFSLAPSLITMEYDTNLSELCAEDGITLSLILGCSDTTLDNLSCENATKISFQTGPLESFHPKKLRKEKTRLSELGLPDPLIIPGGDHE